MMDGPEIRAPACVEKELPVSPVFPFYNFVISLNLFTQILLKAASFEKKINQNKRLKLLFFDFQLWNTHSPHNLQIPIRAQYQNTKEQMESIYFHKVYLLFKGLGLKSDREKLM